MHRPISHHPPKSADSLPVVDLDDTSDCPAALLCEVCREPADDLAVATIDTPVGVLCAPLCGDCAERGHLPSWSWTQAAERVGEHCEHLGCDLDEAAEARAVSR